MDININKWPELKSDLHKWTRKYCARKEDPGDFDIFIDHLEGNLICMVRRSGEDGYIFSCRGKNDQMENPNVPERKGKKSSAERPYIGYALCKEALISGNGFTTSFFRDDNAGVCGFSFRKTS
ncbi:hypothetical protein HY450_00495 [Candidatus Pacearchaeota archaeon]|nr:hypothetical protein [Candidatus Pacearchaeota archaeon]